MERTPAYLAALSSAAVAGLDPVSVEALPSLPHQLYDVGFVMDTQHRRWVIRAPRDEAAAARMEQGFALLTLLGRRLPFAVPTPKGFVALKGVGRAVVYPYLPGHNLEFSELPPGPGLAAELGRAIAALHNEDPRVFEEAGAEAYDTDGYRVRRLSELDRAAATGRVPTMLLERWEKALEDVALWRFATTPTHGDLSGEEVLAVFEGEDASTGRIRALTGWDDAKVADPAEDFAILVDEASEAAVDTVLEAYAHARVERPDANLLVRARLYAELRQLRELMAALGRGDDAAVEGLSTQLRRLDDELHSEADDDYRRTSLAPVLPRRRTPPPPPIEEAEDDEDDDVVAPREPLSTLVIDGEASAEAARTAVDEEGARREADGDSEPRSAESAAPGPGRPSTTADEGSSSDPSADGSSKSLEAG